MDGLMTTADVLRILNIPRNKLVYLFESRRLKSEEFPKLSNGQRIYRKDNLAKIKEALFDLNHKRKGR